MLAGGPGYNRPAPLPTCENALGILSDFERRLEGAIEGIFTRAFRTGLQPVELANRILKEMEANKTVGVHQVWVPNAYVFHLSPADHDRFAQTEGALRRELEQVVREAAAERGFGLVGPPEVRFQTDPGLERGRFRCEPLLVEGPEPAPAPPGPEAGSRAELVLIRDGKPVRSFTLARDRVVIGRLSDCDVVVADPGASRRHAEIRHRDGRWVITDLGSTNGTRVNGAAVSEQALEDGDRITVGRTVLEFRRR
jgi:hypothetical protein